MISIEESIPSKNDNYRIAEDVFFVQFNDISFFVEDTEQENFYYCILRNLFPEMKIEKIFPLNGKDNVINECKSNIGDKNKIFIVDKDFDDLLNKIEIIPNLFYLERYSIENHLINKSALIDYIISEKPKLKRLDINNNFDFETCMTTIKNSLNLVIDLHLLVQKMCPKLKNISLNHERFFDFNNGNFNLREDQILVYKTDIQNELNSKDKRLKVNSQLKKIKKIIDINSNELCIKHMPGKYLIKMIKQYIESLFGLVSRNIDSFCYRVAEKNNFQCLNNFKSNIELYLA